MTEKIVYALIVILISCNSKTETGEVDFSTSGELGSQKVDVLSYSGKRDHDIVKHLYEEALEQDSNLKSLDNKISEMNEVIQDSLEEFNEYVDYNQLYYQSAQNYIQSIKDTTKRNIISTYFSTSKEKFERRITEHKNLEKISAELEGELLDQHILMKLIISEKLINSYQNKEPVKTPIKSVNDEIRTLIDESKKYTNIKK